MDARDDRPGAGERAGSVNAQARQLSVRIERLGWRVDAVVEQQPAVVAKGSQDASA